jgi:hypothetical protein
MEADRSNRQPEEEEAIVIAENNDAVREHLTKLWNEGIRGMSGFMVGDEIEVWNIKGSEASMVMKVRKSDSSGRIAEWERERDFKFSF